MDLPFKKKHSAIALRDAQLLFSPYNTEQLVSIIEEKINLKYSSFPTKLRLIKNIFFEIIEDKAKELIANKVAKHNGDIRIAFDLIKTSFTKLYEQIKHYPSELGELPPDEKIRVTHLLVNQVHEEKYGSKVFDTIKSQPR